MSSDKEFAYGRNFRYTAGTGIRMSKDDEPFLYEQPKGTEKIHKEYDGMCCEGDEET